MKEIDLETYTIPASGRSKNYRNSKNTVVYAGSSSVGGSTNIQNGGSADTALVAGNLDENSTDWNKILRKDKDDETQFVINFAKGLRIASALIDELLTTASTDSASDTNIYSAMMTDKRIKNALATLADLYISKKTDDTAEGVITFLKGLKLGSGGKMIDSDGNAVLESVKMGDFEHLLKGMGLYKNASGHWCVECDEIEVRMKAVFEALEIRKLYHSGGNMDLSPAGSKVTKVESVTDSAGNVTGYKCYMKSDDGTMATTNTWREKDLAICKTWNVKEGTSYGVKNQYYWRVVTSVGDGYVVLGNGAGQMDSGSTVPAVGDDIVARGNTDPASGRCSYIEMVTVDDDGIAPALMMWADVRGFTDDTKGKRTCLISPQKVEFATKIFRLIDYDNVLKPIAIYRGVYDSTTTYYYYNTVTHSGSLWILDGVTEGSSIVGVEPTSVHSQWTQQISHGADGEPGADGVAVWLELTSSVITIDVDSSGKYTGGAVAFPSVRIRNAAGYLTLDELSATCGSNTCKVNTQMTDSSLNDANAIMLSMNANKASASVMNAGSWAVGDTKVKETINLSGKATVSGVQYTVAADVNIVLNVVGTDGDDGASLVIAPGQIVLATDETGVVSDYSSAKSTIKFGIGTNFYDAGSVTISSSTNCTAEILTNNVIHITKVNQESITLADGSTANVSKGSGYVDFSASLTINSKSYSASGRVYFVVDVQKVTSSLIKRNSEIKASVDTYKKDTDGKIKTLSNSVSVNTNNISTISQKQTSDETLIGQIQTSFNNISLTVSKHHEFRNLIPFALLNATHGNLNRTIHLENGKYYIASGCNIGIKYSANSAWYIPTLNKVFTWTKATGDYVMQIGVSGDIDYSTNPIAYAQIEEVQSTDAIASSFTRKESDYSTEVKNLFSSPLAVSATFVAAGNSGVKSDYVVSEQFGRIQNITGTGCNLCLQCIPNTITEDVEVTLFVIAKSTGGTSWAFGWYDSKDSIDKWNALNTTNAKKIELGDGWYIYYINILSSSDMNTAAEETFWGLNTVVGSWQFASFGLVYGGVPPYEPIMGDLQSANDRETGLYVQDRKITQRADQFFIESNSGDEIAVFYIGSDGKPYLNAGFINAQALSAYQVAQPFKQYANFTAMKAGKSMSWFIIEGNDPSGSLSLDDKLDGTTLHIFNSTSAQKYFIVPVWSPSAPTPVQIKIVIPSYRMLTAMCMRKYTSSSSLMGLYMLCPYSILASSGTLYSYIYTVSNFNVI